MSSIFFSNISLWRINCLWPFSSIYLSHFGNIISVAPFTNLYFILLSSIMLREYLFLLLNLILSSYFIDFVFFVFTNSNIALSVIFPPIILLSSESKVLSLL